MQATLQRTGVPSCLPCCSYPFPSVPSNLPHSLAIKCLGGRQSKARAQQVVRTADLRTQATVLVENDLDERIKQAYEEGYQAGLRRAKQDVQQEETETPAQSQSQSPQLVVDSLGRSAVKGLSWRVVSTATTILLALFVFGDSVQFEQALEMGAVEFVSKYLLFFVHERMWMAVTFIL